MTNTKSLILDLESRLKADFIKLGLHKDTTAIISTDSVELGINTQKGRFHEFGTNFSIYVGLRSAKPEINIASTSFNPTMIEKDKCLSQFRMENISVVLGNWNEVCAMLKSYTNEYAQIKKY